MDSSRRYPAWLAPLAVFALTLAVRLLFLYSSAEQTWPHSIWYEGDAPVWVEFATSLHQGIPFEFDLPIRTPGVAFLLYLVQPSGPPYDFVFFKILWCVFSAVSGALVFVLIAHQFGSRVAWIASALYVFAFSASVLSTSLNNEVPYALVLSGILLLTARFDRTSGLPAACGLGVLHGLATLLRSEHTLLLLLLAGRSVWKGSRRLQVGVVVVVSVLICLPWSIRGYQATQRYNEMSDGPFDYQQAWPPWTEDARALMDSLPAFTRRQSFEYFTQLAREAGDREINAERLRQLYQQTFGSMPEPLGVSLLSSSQGGLSFALANHPEATGGFSKAGLDNRWSPDPGFHPALPSHVVLYNHGYRIGLQRLAEDPARWMELVVAKLMNFSEGITMGFTAWNLPYGRGGVRKPVDLVTPMPDRAVPWRILFFLVLAHGLWLAKRQKQGGLWGTVLLYKVLVTVLYYGYARQSASVAPAFYVFVALSIDSLWTRFRGASGLKWERALGIGLLLLAFGAELLHFQQRRVLPIRVIGAVRPAPQWGPGGFESFSKLELIPTQPRSQTP